MEPTNDFLLTEGYCELYNSSGTIGETRKKIYFENYTDLLYKAECIALNEPNYLYSFNRLKEYVIERH